MGRPEEQRAMNSFRSQEGSADGSTPFPLLHHIEICVSDGPGCVGTLVRSYGFRLEFSRTGSLFNQWVVRSGKAVFVVTQKKQREGGNDRRPNPTPPMDPFLTFCCGDERHSIDSVFNAAFEVKDVRRATRRVIEAGGRLLRPVQKVADELGTVEYSVVTSRCGNVVHSLLNRSTYRGGFLPGFRKRRSSEGGEEEEEEAFPDRHVDHITYVCKAGQSKGILEWYEAAFGMERFQANRSDTPENGLVIEDNVNIRMRALQYWSCAETGLMCPRSRGECAAPDRMLRLVIAESLPHAKNPHIESFLEGHRGPGLQHIGLHTENILRTVSKLRERGVLFRSPPPVYYEQVAEMMMMCDEDADALQCLGVLIDCEPVDDDEGEEKEEDFRYLMQIFTHPLFSDDTFFLEIIQRCGAKGFGSGNVTALCRSIDIQNARLAAEAAARLK